MSRTALVLSAGGMFGAYQAGVWKVLQHAAQIDMVVGVSVGALNGWLIAGGYSGEQLAERWLDPSAAQTLAGWRETRGLQAQTERLVAEARPKLPFGLVVVEVPRMRPVLIRTPEITAAHLRATCSIPIYLPTVRTAGKCYCDGGIFEKLPFWAAFEMGATRIIAVDSLPPLNVWWLKASIAAMQMVAPRRARTSGEVTIVEPSRELGDARAAVFWQRENIARWIDLGESDARRIWG